MSAYDDCCVMVFTDQGNAIDAFDCDPEQFHLWARRVAGRITLDDPCGVVQAFSSSLEHAERKEPQP